MKTDLDATGDKEAAPQQLQRVKTSWVPLSAWAVALAFLVLVAYLVPSIQRSLVVTPPPSTVTVGARHSDMRQAVRAEFTVELPEQLVSRTSGIVSSVSIEPGDVVDSGAPILVVNGIQVTAFDQDVPLYRPLSHGDRGTDVASLRKFLHEFGVLGDSTESTRFDWSVSAAVREFQASIGAAVDGVFLPEYVMFVPRGFKLTDTVRVRVGDLVASGDVVATATPSLTGVRFLPASEEGKISDFGLGTLVFTVGDSRVPLSSTEPTEEELLELERVLPSTLGSQDQASTANTVIVEGVLSLEEPRSYGTVPSGTLFLARSGAKCLFALSEDVSSDAIVAIETDTAAIAFGELGATYIDPDLVGLEVVRDPTVLDIESLALCG